MQASRMACGAQALTISILSPGLRSTWHREQVSDNYLVISGVNEMMQAKCSVACSANSAAVIITTTNAFSRPPKTNLLDSSVSNIQTLPGSQGAFSHIHGHSTRFAQPVLMLPSGPDSPILQVLVVSEVFHPTRVRSKTIPNSLRCLVFEISCSIFRDTKLPSLGIYLLRDQVRNISSLLYPNKSLLHCMATSLLQGYCALSFRVIFPN